MKNRINSVILSVTLALSLALGTAAIADDSAPVGSSGGSTAHHHFHKRMKEVFAACAKANGITLPAKGSSEAISSGDRTALQACVKEFREDVHTCLQNAGISKSESGQKRSAVEKAAFEQCRSQALSEISGGSAVASSK